MDIHALQQIVHKTRDARRKQTIPKFSPADRDQLIHKYHPDFRASAYRPIKFGPNEGDKTVVELATLLEGDSPIQDDLALTPHYRPMSWSSAAGEPVALPRYMHRELVPRQSWPRNCGLETPTA